MCKWTIICIYPHHLPHWRDPWAPYHYSYGTEQLATIPPFSCEEAVGQSTTSLVIGSYGLDVPVFLDFPDFPDFQDVPDFQDFQVFPDFQVFSRFSSFSRLSM